MSFSLLLFPNFDNLHYSTYGCIVVKLFNKTRNKKDFLKIINLNLYTWKIHDMSHQYVSESRKFCQFLNISVVPNFECEVHFYWLPRIWVCFYLIRFLQLHKQCLTDQFRFHFTSPILSWSFFLREIVGNPIRNRRF